MDPTKETKAETEANKVLEYYKKYSQNPDLIKYFTGPEASVAEKKITDFNVPDSISPEKPKSAVMSAIEGVQDNEKQNSEVTCDSPQNMNTSTSLDIEINLISEPEPEEIEEKNVSRSSSVASNKIEWDNGADIGYKNSYKFSTRKSASFPNLLTNNLSVSNNILLKVTPEKSVTDNIQELRKKYHQLTFSSENSSSINKERNVSSKNSSGGNNETPDSSSGTSRGNNISSENSSGASKENHTSSISKEPSISSSSSHENKKGKMSKKSTSSSDFSLKRKIGCPVAYSTPHEESSSKESLKSLKKHDGYTVTPMPVKTKRNLNNNKLFDVSEKQIVEECPSPEKINTSNMNDIREELKKKSDKLMKKINLCITKPISVECISLEGKKSINKIVQTSFSSDKSSKCVQTESSKFENEVSHRLNPCKVPTQKIEYIKAVDESKEEIVEHLSGSDRYKLQASECPNYSNDNSNCSKDIGGTIEDFLKEPNSKSTQTDYEASKKAVRSRKTICNIREFKHEKIKKINKPVTICQENKYIDSTETSSLTTSSHSSGEIKLSIRNSESSDFGDRAATSAKEFPSEEMILTEMISLNYSKNLNTDIKRSIDILQKLLKSKKYDQATKKHYIKKIVQKIVNSRYSDDSTNSDLFMPKKTSSEQKFVNKTKFQPIKHQGATRLMDNLPWYPATEPIYVMHKSKMEKPGYNTMSKIDDLTRMKNTNFLNRNYLTNLDVISNHPITVPIAKAPITPETKVDSTKSRSLSPNNIILSNNGVFNQNECQNLISKQKNSRKNDDITKETPNYLTNLDVYRNPPITVPIAKAPITPETKVDSTKSSSLSPNDLILSNNGFFTQNENQNLISKQKNSRKNEETTKEIPKSASNPTSRLEFNPVQDKEYRPISSEGKIGSKNWRTSKTLSEKILENRDQIDLKGQGDYLLNVVKNERHHQISWINNEIEHLSKLKELLEKKPKNSTPDSQLKDVISSLLKMKVDDMKDLPKSFEVFICQCSATNGRCNCNKTREIQNSQKRSACLTPGYYTIETQLDPDGNLLDLTVYDGNGEKKYNYQSDGIVDDISICSKNHGAEVKLKPKADECPGRLVSEIKKVCRACGRWFMPSDSEESICCGCTDLPLEPERVPSDDLQCCFKICKSCRMLFKPSRDNQNTCICQNCYNEVPQPDWKTIAPSNTEECEACGRLFIRQDSDMQGICLCKSCRKELIQEKRQSPRMKSTRKICKICGEIFLESKKNPQQNICEDCLECTLQKEFKCTCQRVTFSEPAESSKCKCATRDDASNAKMNECPRKNISQRPCKESKVQVSAKEFCQKCGRESSRCVCGPKFVPKKPKLIGKNREDSHAAKGFPCSHCAAAVQASMPSKTKPSNCLPCSPDKKKQMKSSDGSRVQRSMFRENDFNSCSKSSVSKTSQVRFSSPCSTSSQSSRESMKPAKCQKMTETKSQQQAKNKHCCKACSKCDVSSTSTPSPSPKTRQKRSVSKAVPCPSDCSTNKDVSEIKTECVNKMQSRKSCQCCTCMNCGSQTKKIGDKNVRCQCCICENCGVQTSLDENGKQRKVMNSKWCQPKRPDAQSNKKKSADSKSNRSSKKCDQKCRKTDELDNTDDSMQSISSGNIICITPTKYKNMQKGKSDSECQCATPRRRTGSDQKLQICPSVLEALCKSVNTSAQQERKRSFCQASPDESRSCESLEYPCKPLKPKAEDQEENSSESSLTCPSKKTSCPAKPRPCPGASNKPCPSYPPKPCPGRKKSPRDNSSESSLTCPSKKPSCPAKPKPCPGAGDKPCPAYPPKPCPGRKESSKDNSSESSLICPSKKPSCPAKPKPCPGGGDKPCPAYPPKPCPGSKKDRKRKDKSRRRSSDADDDAQENEPLLMPISITTKSPLQQPQANSKTSSRSEDSSRELQTQDEVPSMSSGSPNIPSPDHANSHQTNVQLYLCTTENPAQAKQTQSTQQKKCGCSMETCKCNQTATHEEKYIQYPAFIQCTCQTEPKEDANIQCNCKENTGVSCKCGETQQDKENMCQCKKSSSNFSSSTNSGSGSFMSCICCKKEKILKNLINKIPLCDPCQEVNQKNFYPHPYSNPLHSCMCYSLVNRDDLCMFKQTLTELERLDVYQQYCEVLQNCKCCKKCGCKCKLPKKYKNGCAYFLKLEDECPNKHCEEEGESDFDSYCGEEEEEASENCLPEVTVKVPNCKGACSRKNKNGEGRGAKKYTSCPSIQNYLCTMKPEFVARAERRRRILRDATYQREENSENRKLNFIDKINYLKQKRKNEVYSESNIPKHCGYQANTYCVFDIELNESPKKYRPRVFKNFKEMKDLTKRHYLHLTEVKSKKNLHKEKRLKEANRLLANTFTRRLQRSTLRGNVDIPLNVKVVSF